MSYQLSLNLRLKDGSSFSNFLATANLEALERLRSAVVAAAQGETREPALFLWGASGSGNTHLLQAACRLAQEFGISPVYVPLRETSDLSISLLEDVGDMPLVCLDDVDCIAGKPEWETALFSLSEHLRHARGTLIAAAAGGPNHIGLRMPELSTRLAWGPVYQLQPLDDVEKLDAVRLRARNRGFEMSEEVVRYILNRYPRDTHSLFGLLDRIDRASLAHQRRVTIPFIRSLEAG